MTYTPVMIYDFPCQLHSLASKATAAGRDFSDWMGRSDGGSD